MRENYKPLGDYIEQVNIRNTDLKVDYLVGLTINKKFIPSVANTIGTDMSNYKIIEKNQFACSLMQVSRDGKMPIARFDEEIGIMSPAYPIFKITDKQTLMPEYLMMWFEREEFDREAAYYAVGGVRGNLTWEDFCDMKIPVPPISEQEKIVAEYQAIENKIKVNEQICEKLEATAQAIYKEWFVEFNFPNEEGKPYKDSGGKMVWNEELDKEVPEGWEVKELGEISTITMGQSPSGDSYNEKGSGKIFYQGRTDFGYRIPSIRVYTTEPKRMAKKGDVLMSVRAPVGDLNIASSDCCIGRGLASIRSQESSYIFYLLKNLKDYFDSSEGTGTIFSSINKDELNELKSIYDKKTTILYHKVINNIDDSIIQISTINTKLTELKSLLLARMVK